MIITGIEKDQEIMEFKAKLLGSLLYFTQTFFKYRTGREFSLSHPASRESHHVTVCRHLTKAFYLEITRLIINLPPGHFKSTLLQHFIAWAWAHYPDCLFIYLSYSHDEAAKNTAVIKDIVSLPQYKRLFGVEIHPDFSARDDFKTKQGGALKAFGSGGAVTGKDAGFPDCDRFSGCLVMDDMHKPDEVHSETMRQGVINNYKDTIAQRPRGPRVPQIFLGQCLREADLSDFLKNGEDGHHWARVVLQAKDEAGNILDPNVKNRDELEKMEKYNPFVYYAQYQQTPLPAGGGIFKNKDFYLMDDEPKMLATFLTADTAETDKNYNDPTVFSFWGVYKINDMGRKEIEQYALHWLDCVEIWVEPAELEREFLSFYGECSMHRVQPSFAAIEKKSTGVTLISVLDKVRGLNIIDIERTKASGNKIARYFEAQPYVARKLVSLPRNGRHTDMCVKHMGKITANNSHRHDDIADTAYDAIKIALIDKNIDQYIQIGQNPQQKVVSEIGKQFLRTQNIRRSAYG